jgi:nucleotide-binding universal stress UspA family protein
MPEPEAPDPAHADEHPLPWSGPGLLVGVDGSPASLAALRMAVDLGPKLGLPVHALVVWDFASPLSGREFATRHDSTPEADARKVVDAARRAVFPESPPEWFTIGLERGRPSFVLLQHSARSEMLVIGSRGHGGFAGLLLGSVSSVCVSRALCPVMVVPVPPARAGGTS